MNIRERVAEVQTGIDNFFHGKGLNPDQLRARRNQLALGLCAFIFIASVGYTLTGGDSGDGVSTPVPPPTPVLSTDRCRELQKIDPNFDPNNDPMCNGSGWD